MYKRVLVPLDGSASSMQALPYARLIARATGAEIELFRVVPPLIEFLQRTPPMAAAGDTDEAPAGTANLQRSTSPWEERYEEARRQTRADLEGIAGPMRDHGLSVRCTIDEGDAATVTAAAAEREPGTLMVTAVRGTSGGLFKRRGDGSGKAAQKAKVPTLMVRPEETDGQAIGEPEVRRIILPLDGSPEAEQAIPHAIAVAKGLHAPVEVLQSARKAKMTVGPSGTDIPGQMSDTAPSDYLQRTVEHMRIQGVGQVEAAAVHGDLSNTVAEAAQSTPGSLVVMHDRPASGLGRLFGGESQGEKVLDRAGRPVLLVKAA